MLTPTAASYKYYLTVHYKKKQAKHWWNTWLWDCFQKAAQLEEKTRRAIEEAMNGLINVTWITLFNTTSLSYFLPTSPRRKKWIVPGVIYCQRECFDTNKCFHVE